MYQRQCSTGMRNRVLAWLPAFVFSLVEGWAHSHKINDGSHVVTIPLKHQRLGGEKRISTLRLHSATKFLGAASSVEPRLNLQEYNHAYYGPITIGSNGQVLNVLFDTGSANLIVPSSTCNSAGCHGSSFDVQGSHSGSFLNVNGKSTDKDHARELVINFASGRTSGNAFQDRVCIGELGSNICSNSTNFLLAESESDDFAKFRFDGILGLAPPGQLSMGPGYSVLDNLVQQGALPKRMFAFFLSENEGASQLSLGGYDEKLAGSNLKWLHVNTMRGSWEIRLNDISVNGETQDLCPHALGCYVELDSGCGGLGMPKGMADALAEKIGFIASRSQCHSPASELPSIEFVLDGHPFALKPEDYIEVSKKDPDRCRLRFQDMPGTSVTSPIVLGHPFLLRYYTVYDRDFLRIGLAPIVDKNDDGDVGPALAAMRHSINAASKHE